MNLFCFIQGSVNVCFEEKCIWASAQGEHFFADMRVFCFRSIALSGSVYRQIIGNHPPPDSVSGFHRDCWKEVPTQTNTTWGPSGEHHSGKGLEAHHSSRRRY